MKEDKKGHTGQYESKSGIRVYCEGLERRPVTHAELEVLETYASDLIRKLVANHVKQNEKE